MASNPNSHPIPPASNLSHRKVKQNSSSSSSSVGICPPAAPASNLSHRKGKQTSSSSIATCPPAPPASSLSHRIYKQNSSSSSTTACPLAAPSLNLSHHKGKQTSSSSSTATCPPAAPASNLSHRKGKQTSSSSSIATCPPAAPASNLSHRKGKQSSSSTTRHPIPPASKLSHHKVKRNSSSSTARHPPASNLSHGKGKRTYSSSTATCPPAALPSSSSVDHPEIKYDVFISFRGPDVRSTFLSHLLEALSLKKIDYFVDDQNLKPGDQISTLFSAIKKSEILLVLFSEDYAASKWCLQELDQIIQCMENQKQIILPVFYKVDPSTVRHQKGKYYEAFDKHGKRFDDDRLQKWKAALKKASDLSGFDSSNYNTEAILIKEIVEHVSEELRKTGNQIDLEGFVGIQNHIEDLEKLLCTETQDIFIIGIWGMGGVGKTTVAEILYNRLQLHNKYDGSHFLCIKEGLETHGDKKQLRRDLLSKLLSEKKENFDDVTLHGIPTWVKRRLNRKKILVVLDDINEPDQLEILTGGHEWFGSGSRIIMTSRDQHLFSSKCDKIYEVKPLKFEDASQLFEKTLTEKCHIRNQDRYELSKEVLNYAQGVPLAIKVLARFLYDKNKDEWKSKLEKLEKIPDSKIQNILELSYNGLDDYEHKEIFLYLACFFRYESKEQITMSLDACGYHTNDGLKVLQDKALINYCEIFGSLHMHDLIRVMGREIVRQSSPKNPGLRIHLWDSDDICKVFKDKMGTTTIESIRLSCLRLKENLRLGPRAFVGMNNLKLLQFDKDDHKVYPPDEGFEWLPNELRCCNWKGYPSKSFPSRLCLENLVELDFSSSKLQRLWDGVQDLPNLKVIDLSFSRELTEVPDLSKAPNLRRLELSACNKLQYFGLSPNHNIIELDSAEYEECKKISIEESKEDDHLDLCGTSLPTKPSCKYYVFPSLQFLRLDGCTSFVELPDDIALCLPSLQELCLYRTNVKTIPASIKHLSRLKKLRLDFCNQLRYIPELPPTVAFINVRDCRSLETIPFTSNSTPLSHKHQIIIYMEDCVKLDDHALRAIVRNFKFTIQRMISASIKDGHAFLSFSRSKIPKWFDDLCYRVTQDPISPALVLPLHSEVTGFIFFAFCQELRVYGIKCHIAYLSDIELRNSVPVSKGHVQFTYVPIYTRDWCSITDHVCFWYEGSLYLKIMEELSRIKASAVTTDDLRALVWFELLSYGSKRLINTEEWAVYSNCAMGFYDVRFL